MSNASQIAQLVEPFLRRHAEFALVGRSVVMKPVDHLMRRFYLDRSSAKGYVQPSWSIATTFGPPPNHLVGTGTRLVRGVGYVDDPQIQAQLIEEMERITSEILIPSDADSLVALSWKAEPIFGPDSLEFGMPLLVKGAFAEALPYFTATLKRIDKGIERRVAAVQGHGSADSREARRDLGLLGRWREAQQGLRTICDLLSTGDATTVAVQLHQWEAAAVRMHKVEHLWVPSPFPFESGPGN